MTQRWVNLGLIIFSFAFFLVLQKIVSMVWDIARLPALAEWPVGPVDIISFLLTLGTVLSVRLTGRSNEFLNEVALELSKVTWPGRKETFLSAGVVVVMVAICVVILWGFDFIWGSVTSKFLVR